MSNPNYTHIVLLVDASGSMEKIKPAVIDGINNFIESQKTLPADPDRNLSFDDDLGDSNKAVKCTATLAMFSEQKRNQYNSAWSGRMSLTPADVGNGEPPEAFNYIKLYENQDITTVPALTKDNYDTYGGTPLVDAYVKTINECVAFISGLPESERPGRVIFISNTDGIEETSNEYRKVHTKTDLKAKIEVQQAQNWQFIYLGANQDAIQESSSYGVAKGQSLTYTANASSVMDSYSKLSNNVLMKRCVAPQAMFSACISDDNASAFNTSGAGNITTTATTLHTSMTSDKSSIVTSALINKMKESGKSIDEV